MDNYHGENFLDDFVQFLNKRIDGRLQTVLTEDNRTAELESKIEELESQIEYFSDHEVRICELEDIVAAIDRSELLKDLTAIVDRKVHELASRGRLRLYVASYDPDTVENVS